jgi:hypothetical protein
VKDDHPAYRAKFYIPELKKYTNWHDYLVYYKAEVQNYLDNPVGVGEHGNLIETMDTLVAKIAEAEDKLIVLETHFNE